MKNPIVFLNGGTAAITADPGGADHLTLHIGTASGAARIANFATASDMLDLAPGLGFATAEGAAASPTRTRTGQGAAC